MLKSGDRVWVKEFCCGFDGCGGDEDCLAWRLTEGWAVRNKRTLKGTITDGPYRQERFTQGQTALVVQLDIYTIALDRYRWWHWLRRKRIKARLKHLESVSTLELLAEV